MSAINWSDRALLYKKSTFVYDLHFFKIKNGNQLKLTICKDNPQWPVFSRDVNTEIRQFSICLISIVSFIQVFRVYLFMCY